MDDTLLERFIAIFGTYQPIEVTETVTTAEDVITTTTHYMTDWGYIGMIVCFVLLFWCCLRILGGIICHD